jgi:hypothetical protein
MGAYAPHDEREFCAMAQKGTTTGAFTHYLLFMMGRVLGGAGLVPRLCEQADASTSMIALSPMTNERGRAGLLLRTRSSVWRLWSFGAGTLPRPWLQRGPLMQRPHLYRQSGKLASLTPWTGSKVTPEPSARITPSPPGAEKTI